MCGLCKCSEEMVDHLFFHCLLASKAQVFVSPELGISLCLPRKIDDFIKESFGGASKCFFCGIVHLGPCFGFFERKE